LQQTGRVLNPPFADIGVVLRCQLLKLINQPGEGIHRSLNRCW
jgi:hypothetical protein